MQANHRDRNRLLVTKGCKEIESGEGKEFLFGVIILLLIVIMVAQLKY